MKLERDIVPQEFEKPAGKNDLKNIILKQNKVIFLVTTVLRLQMDKVRFKTQQRLRINGWGSPSLPGVTPQRLCPSKPRKKLLYLALCLPLTA